MKNLIEFNIGDIAYILSFEWVKPECTNCSGTGKIFVTFKGNENSNPVIGEKGKLHTGTEIKIEVVFEKHLQSKILKALLANHIYEEVAYEIYDLQNSHQNIGLGMIGEFETEMNEKDFSDDVSGADLDVPGSELDDEQEKLGSEDEENNYYSIGGDNHNDLEESKGD